MGKLEPAEWYDDYYAQHLHPGGMTAIHVEAARAIMRESPEFVLDLGCGPGWFHRVLRQAGFQGYYEGVDFSATAIAQARCSTPEDKRSVFLVQDLQASGVRAFSSQFVVVLETLEHLEHDVAVLEACTTPGCRVLVSVPTYDSPSHVRHFKSSDDLGARYGIAGDQWEKDRQLYLLGTFVG